MTIRLAFGGIIWTPSIYVRTRVFVNNLTHILGDAILDRDNAKEYLKIHDTANIAKGISKQGIFANQRADNVFMKYKMMRISKDMFYPKRLGVWNVSENFSKETSEEIG